MSEVVLKADGLEMVAQQDGSFRTRDGRLVEFYEGRWRQVLQADRQGWWRFHEHYDRDGYCDNPARGY